MTRLVDNIIRGALASNSMPQGKLVSTQSETGLPQSEPCNAVA